MQAGYHNIQVFPPNQHYFEGASEIWHAEQGYESENYPKTSISCNRNQHYSSTFLRCHYVSYEPV